LGTRASLDRTANCQYPVRPGDKSGAVDGELGASPHAKGTHAEQHKGRIIQVILSPARAA
jgi:hypothetical protein